MQTRKERLNRVLVARALLCPPTIVRAERGFRIPYRREARKRIFEKVPGVALRRVFGKRVQYKESARGVAPERRLFMVKRGGF